MGPGKKATWYALITLFAINTANFFDRLILGAVGEPVRKEFGLGDASLGLLATAFTLLYAFVGLPLGRLADIAPRKYILSAGVFFWSLMTAGTGVAQSFWQIFAMRLGVGIGEASCAPAATSLIADLFPSEHRAKAMSIFMLGLPIGIGLSFAVSGSIAQAYGWRAAFLIAGVPGIVLAVACLFIREPVRGQLEPGAAAGLRETRDGKNPVAIARGADLYRRILSSPTMRWLIISGVIHNFCLYTLSSFMTPYMMRWHGMDIRDASINAMLINGVFTLPGLLFGGFVGDAAKSHRAGGGLLLAAFATLAAVPLLWLAVSAARTDAITFVAAMGGAFALMYFYYSNVYAAIQDVVEPRLRGSAMAVYFFAMYLLGGALGPYLTGLLSDSFTRRAATLAGVSDTANAALEPFRAVGLHNAMYVIPVLAIALTAVLFAASRSISAESPAVNLSDETAE
ncbi:MAG: spinster family MFS transporter [Pyrinomonadaceae bacterium]